MPAVPRTIAAVPPPPNPVRRARLRDVAEKADVSVATASLVLTGAAQARISEATRELVRKAAQELGYVPNRLARGLVRGRTQTIGVIIPDLSNAFYAGIVDGIEAACDESGLRVLLAHGRGNAAYEAHQAQLLLAQQVDGLVVVIADGPPEGTRDWLKPMVGNGVACVLIDEADLRLSLDTVTSDDQEGAALAVRHLARLGHRRIGLLAAGTERSSARNRQSGYRRGLESAGLPLDETLVIGTSYDPDDAPAAFDRLWLAKPTALLACSDYQAGRVFTHTRRLGIRIPDDLAIVGYSNDRHLAAALGLTSVDQGTREQGRLAVTRLLRRLDQPGDAPASLTVPPTLAVRTSCGSRSEER